MNHDHHDPWVVFWYDDTNAQRFKLVLGEEAARLQCEAAVRKGAIVRLARVHTKYVPIFHREDYI